MSNADRDRLVEMMTNTLDWHFEMLECLQEMPSDLDDLTPERRERLAEDYDLDAMSADDLADSLREALDPLDYTLEPGEPFDVALTLGGPNIYLVDLGGFGGKQLRGWWGESHVMTGHKVTALVDFYRELVEPI